jgi:hypothetical protein
MERRKEGRKERRKEGRKEGRKEDGERRKEGPCLARPPWWCP